MGKLLLVACTNIGRYIIETLITDSDISAELVGVINLNSQQSLHKSNYDSYADLVIKYGFPIFYCNNINDTDTVAFIKKCNPDIILQSGWSQKFSDEVLALPKYGCIGEHPAPLPKGRGAACVNWAILTGETEWGDSYFKMVSEYDKGELYAQQFFKIEKYDTVYTVYEKVAQCAVKVIKKYATKWSDGQFDIVKQDERKATYYKRRTPTDGEIKDFSQEASELHNFIRSQTHPYPGAYISTKIGRLYILSSDIPEGITTTEPAGTVVGISNRGGVFVSMSNNTVIEIKRIKLENYPSMWASDLISSNKLPVDFLTLLN